MSKFIISSFVAFVFALSVSSAFAEDAHHASGDHHPRTEL